MLILFTIIDPERPKLLRYVYIACFASVIFSIFFLQGQDIGLWFTIGPFAIIFVVGAIFNQVREKGRLSMNGSVIQTEINGEVKVYKVSELTAIMLEISEFDGDFSNPKSPPKSGLFNYLSFWQDGQMYKYELQLLPAHKPWLNELFRIWRQDAINFEVLRDGKEITKV